MGAGWLGWRRSRRIRLWFTAARHRLLIAIQPADIHAIAERGPENVLLMTRDVEEIRQLDERKIGRGRGFRSTHKGCATIGIACRMASGSFPVTPVFMRLCRDG